MKKLQQLVEEKTISEDMKKVIEILLQGYASIAVTGGLATGKTTLCESLIESLTDKRERVFVLKGCKIIEKLDSQCESEVDTDNIADALMYVLKMSPTYTYVDMSKGTEEINTLLLTGHSVIYEMHTENKAEFSENEMIDTILKELDIIIRQSKLKDGSIKITEVSEIIKEDGVAGTNKLYEYEYESGEHKKVGSISDVLKRHLLLMGVSNTDISFLTGE